MRKLGCLVLVGALLATPDAARPQPLPVTARVHHAPAAATIAAKLVAGGLAFPAAFTFGPGGAIWYGERASGEIRVIGPKHTRNTLFFRVPDVVADGEQGLLGVALHPRFPAKPFV